jgi:hypothetical protein
MCYFTPPMNTRWWGLCLVAPLLGCATAPAFTPGATLLAGITHYQGEMHRLGGSRERWPERQRAGGTLKTIITTTIGPSGEFYRLIDLDLRKREFAVTLRETAVRAERAQEMQQEMAHMDEEMAALKAVVRTQLAAFPIERDPTQRIEAAAVRGLLSLALENFSSNGIGRRLEAPSTKVGPFLVTDLGSFAAVREPDGKVFRCFLFGVPDEAAGMKCEPAN